MMILDLPSPEGIKSKITTMAGLITTMAGLITTMAGTDHDHREG
jgi:hypothetical protein